MRLLALAERGRSPARRDVFRRTSMSVRYLRLPPRERTDREYRMRLLPYLMQDETRIWRITKIVGPGDLIRSRHL